jgi:hypothetical protein
VINPVNGLLVNPGDTVSATLQGDPQLILSMSGAFAGATVAVEYTPLGQAVTTWLPYAEVRVDTGFVVQSGLIGPVSNSGFGSGITLRADGTGVAAIRLRLVSPLGSGAVTGGIASVPFPFSANVQVVTGTVNVSGDYLQQMDHHLQQLNEPLGMNKLPMTLNLPLRADLTAIVPT